MVALPKSIQEKCGDVTLAVDVLHVKKKPILVTVSTNIHCVASTFLPLLKHEDIKEAEAFEGLQNHFTDNQVAINAVSKDGHVSEIEWSIWVK